MGALPQPVHGLEAEWQDLARCAETDGAVFFPPPFVEPKAERLAREAMAKEICAGCPVRRECLDWALTTEEPHGVWGGWSESERRQLVGESVRRA